MSVRPRTSPVVQTTDDHLHNYHDSPNDPVNLNDLIRTTVRDGAGSPKAENLDGVAVDYTNAPPPWDARDGEEGKAWRRRLDSTKARTPTPPA